VTIGEFGRRFGRGEIDQAEVGSSLLIAAFVGSPLVMICAFVYSLVGYLLTGRIPEFGLGEVLFVPFGLIGLGIFGVVASAVAYVAATPIVLMLQACGWLSGYALVVLGISLIALPGAFTHNFSLLFSSCGGVTAAIFWWRAGIVNNPTALRPAGPSIPSDIGTN
jgi:hypothetical protein